MAKALQEWSLISTQGNLRTRFALYCGAVIDDNARLVAESKMMNILSSDSITGEVFDVDTRKSEGFKSVSIKNLGVMSVDDDKIVYYADASDGERYYFDIWQASYEMKQDLVKNWLKMARPDGVYNYLQY